MIEKILERLEELYDRNDRQKKTAYDEQDWEKFDLFMHRNEGVYWALATVQEVAKEYGNGWVSVETALPKEEGMYLCTVFHANKYVPWIMRFKNGEFVRPDDVESLDYEILAWQRIAPYQKGE